MNRKRVFRHKKGFTLIELVVVIAIMGILASMVAVSAGSAATGSEKKAATSVIVSYWDSTNNYFLQLNSGFGSAPSLNQIRARLDAKVQGIGTNPPSKVDNGKIYIQYAYNTGTRAKYTITRITYNYKGHYYYSVDGATVIGPKTSL